jgi:hypothetical protein
LTPDGRLGAAPQMSDAELYEKVRLKKEKTITKGWGK